MGDPGAALHAAVVRTTRTGVSMLHADAAYFAVVVCVPVVVRLLMVPRVGEPVRAASLRLGERLWSHLVEHQEPDAEVLRRWAVLRLAQLEGHLARVERLVGRDDDRSATRHRGNRLAYARLLLDVAEARRAAPERIAPPQPEVVWTSTPTVRYLPAPVLVRSSRVEILEAGPSGRWF